MNVFAIAKHKQRIENVFARADGLPYEEEALRSDLARYLCILVAGYIEQSVQHIYTEYSRNSASPQVFRHVERQIRRGTNFNTQNLLTIVSSFDDAWSNEIEQHNEYDRFKSAVDTIYANRHRIAHGDDVGMSYVDVKQYFGTVVDLMELLVQQCER